MALRQANDCTHMATHSLHKRQRVNHVARAYIATLALTTNMLASATEYPAVATAKATHGEMIGPPTTPGGSVAVPQPGTATPEEVAVRIAARLAQLRIRQATKKHAPERKRLIDQASI